jgi:endonuclease/exonuclease/phosphatase family metal-dependent hydrolase
MSRGKAVLFVAVAIFLIGVGMLFSLSGFNIAKQVVGKDGPSGNRLKVMSFNLRYANDKDELPWEKRLPVIAELLKSEQPDVIGTQEGIYRQVQDLETSLPQYGWIGEGREGKTNGEFMAVFYNKERLQPIEYEHFWLSDIPYVAGSKSWGNRLPRMVTWVKFLDQRTDREFYLINTHLDHESEESRNKSVRLIAERIGQFDPNLPVVLTGDFNSRAGTEPYMYLVNQAKMADALRSAETFVGESLGTLNGFKDPTGGGKYNRIDWILFRGDLAVKKFHIQDFRKDGIYPSDHFPIIAEIELRSEAHYKSGPTAKMLPNQHDSGGDAPLPYPALMITEVVPKSAGSEQFGFIEIYNASDREIDLKGYRIHYYYDVEKIWEGKHNIWEIVTDTFNENSKIKPKEVKVIWLKKEKSHNAPLDEFRKNYGVSESQLRDDQVLVLKNPGNEGMNGDKPRAVGIVAPRGELVSGAAYNQQGEIDVVTNESVTFAYPQDRTPYMKKKNAHQKPTPGVLEEGQVP